MQSAKQTVDSVCHAVILQLFTPLLHEDYD